MAIGRWAWLETAPPPVLGKETMNEFSDNRGHERSLFHNLDKVYLRLSLTSACNFRCQYCMPAGARPEKSAFGPATDEELISLVELFSRVREPHKIRLTGGEPLLRKSVVEIAHQLSSNHPDAKLRLTTNGALLSRYARGLFSAGVDTVNISLDSLDARDFSFLARRDQLKSTLKGIDAALEAGMRVKLNTVLIRSLVERGILDLLDFASERNLEIRFIELMPVGEGAKLYPAEYIDADEVMELIAPAYEVSSQLEDGATSERFTFNGGQGSLTAGFIRTTSRPFCGSCDRMRIDSNGQLFTCIRSVFGRPLLAHLRRGDEERVLRLVAEAIHGKIIPDEAWPEYRSMVAIGG